MTLKASIAGLHQGGGKAVVFWDDPDAPRPPELLHAARPRDRRPRRALPRGGGCRRDARRHGRPRRGHTMGHRRGRGARRFGRPVAGHRVGRAPRHARGARAARRRARAPRAARVVVQGAGHVGARLARLLVDDGAEVVVSDVRRGTRRRARARARRRQRAVRARALDGVRHPLAERARRSVPRRDDPAARLSGDRGRGQQPARDARCRSCVARSAGSSSRPTSWWAGRHHQHRGGVHGLRPQRGARACTGRIEATIDAGAGRRRRAPVSRRTAPPRPSRAVASRRKAAAVVGNPVIPPRGPTAGHSPDSA